MANSRNNTTAVAFGGTSTVTTPKALNSTSRFVFDAVTIHADAVAGSLEVYLDNQGTPASGDWADIQVAWSADGSNYETDEHALVLRRGNTFGTDDPGEDPCRVVIPLSLAGNQSFKLIARANQGGTRTINLTARYNEFRMA